MMKSLSSLTAFMVGICLGFAEDNVSSENPSIEQVKEAEAEAAKRYHFATPPDLSERRDIFYSVIDLLKAQNKLEELVAESQKQVVTDAPELNTIDEDDIDHEANAEKNTQQVLAHIKGLFNDKQWEAVLKYIDQQMELVRGFADTYPDNQVLRDSLSLIINYRHQAEEKKIYEEAREQFLALGLSVQGIIWSADQASLAIIDGESRARAINDRVKDCVIVNIDTNRVDFMFPYRRRKFHFQRYIDDE